jgi:peptidoglycan/xylan/chitin deacetylase (PgdA/CDA1 family)
VIVVSPILKRVVYPCLANSGYLRRRAHGGSFCAITYHGVLPSGYESIDSQQDGGLVTAQNFHDQLRLLKKCYQVVSPRQVYDWLAEGKDLPERAVLLTCDDGLRNALTDMAPILCEEQLSCLFFVLGASARDESQTLWYEDLYLLLSNAPAGSYSFDFLPVRIELGDRRQRRSIWSNLLKHLSQYEQSKRKELLQQMQTRFGLQDGELAHSTIDDAWRRRFSLLNAAELRQLANLGMTIGAHTLNHPVLARQTSEMAWQEISGSRSLLESAIGKPVWALAYPFGDAASVTSREMHMAEQAGFQCAFMNIDGGFGAQLPRFALPRVHVTAKMSLSEFEAHVSGFHRDFRSRLHGKTA